MFIRESFAIHVVGGGCRVGVGVVNCAAVVSLMLLSKSLPLSLLSKTNAFASSHDGGFQAGSFECSCATVSGGTLLVLFLSARKLVASSAEPW